MFPDAERERDFFFFLLSFLTRKSGGIIYFQAFLFIRGGGFIHLKMRRLWLRGAKRELFCR